MLVLFALSDTLHPEKPPVERLINSRFVVDVEPMFSGESLQPSGSMIRLADKRTFKVKETPREIQKAFGGR